VPPRGADAVRHQRYITRAFPRPGEHPPATMTLVDPRKASSSSLQPTSHAANVTRVHVSKAVGQLRELVVRANAGEDVELTDGAVRVKLVPVDGLEKRILGQDEGLFEVPADFDEPLSDEVLDAFGV
jgi:antitoxin (DNA-binding transcriptional repressor) of toxin-antitoxin stability system